MYTAKDATNFLFSNIIFHHNILNQKYILTLKIIWSTKNYDPLIPSILPKYKILPWFISSFSFFFGLFWMKRKKKQKHKKYPPTIYITFPPYPSCSQ